MSKRLIGGLIIIPPTIALLLYAPSIVLLAAFLAVSTAGILEFYRMLDKARIPAFRFVGAACGAAMLIATFLGIMHETVWCDVERTVSAAEWQGFVLMGTVLILMVRQFPQKNNEWPLPTIACTLMGVLYVPFLMSFFIRLGLVWSAVDWQTSLRGQTGCYLIFYVVSVVKMADSGALLIGKAFGRHKMFPRLSPGKTWVGLFGGLLAGVGTSALFVRWTGGTFGSIQVGPLHAVTLGIILTIAGMTGDLAESLLKRAAAAKDSGSLFPGIGGILDVFDSLLFAVPVFYLYLRLMM